jgi:hypothetical protein
VNIFALERRVSKMEKNFTGGNRGRIDMWISDEMTEEERQEKEAEAKSLREKGFEVLMIHICYPPSISTDEK